MTLSIHGISVTGKVTVLKTVKGKIVLFLYYVEGYKCFEISKILKITESTVKKRLERGRNLLKKNLGVNECG